MREALLCIIATIFALIYNAILLMVHMASVESKFETTSGVLTVLNTVKDTIIVATILFSIFLG